MALTPIGTVPSGSNVVPETENEKESEEFGEKAVKFGERWEVLEGIEEKPGKSGKLYYEEICEHRI